MLKNKNVDSLCFLSVIQRREYAGNAVLKVGIICGAKVSTQNLYTCGANISTMPFERIKTIKGHQYKYLVENVRENGKTKQNILKYFGRVDKEQTDQESTPTSEERNIQIAKKIVEEYHQTHTYYEEDIFVCSDMAIEVWNMLKTKGINAIILIGNIDKDNASLTECNHAWVLAEVSLDKWYALETTGGYLVYPQDDPRYYKGWIFITPKQFKEYLQLSNQIRDQYSKWNDAQTQCDQLLSQYNQLDNIKINELYINLVERNKEIKDLLELISKITKRIFYHPS